YLLLAVSVMTLSYLPWLFVKLILILFFFGLTGILLYIARKNRTVIFIVIVAMLFSSGYIFTTDYVFNHVLEKHQQQRVNVLLGKKVDVKDADYNVRQSKIAIGSGGLWGKGFLNGTLTKYNFVPEQSTDFIFCTIGEEY